MFNLGGTIFFVTLPFWMYLLRKGAYMRLFTYHLKAHTISNKLVSNVSAQMKEGESYYSYK